jgi:hypothetical protein
MCGGDGCRICTRGTRMPLHEKFQCATSGKEQCCKGRNRDVVQRADEAAEVFFRAGRVRGAECFSFYPSPKGRGWPEGPGEGWRVSSFHPSPAASRHPLPLAEGFAPISVRPPADSHFIPARPDHIPFPRADHRSCSTHSDEIFDPTPRNGTVVATLLLLLSSNSISRGEV